MTTTRPMPLHVRLLTELAFIINWTAAAGQDNETISQFFSAIHRTLSSVKQCLTRDE
jgi:hypothetical protein